MRLIIVFFSPDFWLVGRAIGTVWFDLDFCLAHRMLVLLGTQWIYGQSSLAWPLVPAAESRSTPLRKTL